MVSDTKGFVKRTAETLGFVKPEPQQVRAVGGPAAGVIPPARSEIPFLTPDVAVQIGAVHRSISIITASVAQMELAVFRDGIEIKTPALVKQPNLDDSATGFIEETVYSLAAYGNAYWRLYGSPVANVEVLDPNSVTVTTHERTGKKVYYVGTTEVPASQIKHLKLFRKPGHLKGYGPIQHGQSELIGALRMRSFADNWFGNGVPTGILTSDQTLNSEDAQAFADAWKRFIAENGTAVMGNGLHYEHLGIKPAEAQYLEVQQAQVVGIARLFGIPAMHLLAELSGTSNTYLNLEQANIVFLQTTLVKYMNEIEEALSSLLPRGQRVQFKEDGLLRMDSVTKWSVLKTQWEVGYTSGDELRKAEGKSPLPKPAPAPVGNETNSNEGSEQNGND